MEEPTFYSGGTNEGPSWSALHASRRRSIFWGGGIVLAAVAIAGAAFFVRELAPADAAGGSSDPVTVRIAPREGFTEVADALMAQHLLRSRLAFEMAAVLGGTAFRLQSGTYHFSPAMPALSILHELSRGSPAITVTIPEGLNLYEMDRTLAAAGVIAPGDLIGFTGDGNLEGKLFPDTYQFFEGSNATSVVQKFLNNFNEKAQPILAADPAHERKNLILASLVQEEAPTAHDESMIAGIIQKRLAAGMRLQIDATVCYAKQIALPGETVNCADLVPGDFAADSPYRSLYNTYLFAGLPPGPIDDPGIVAIAAAMHPIASPYWYYLSDPATGKIIYAATLTEQEANIKKYLSHGQ